MPPKHSGEGPPVRAPPSRLLPVSRFLRFLTCCAFQCCWAKPHLQPGPPVSLRSVVQARREAEPHSFLPCLPMIAVPVAYSLLLAGSCFQFVLVEAVWQH
mmetsp:Transcript_45421/g.106708  ORF Transcript_45421/g.106708 Transcript_45421/m.106708 type:complete len:100 (-) Transcript_45421:249-548(-)